MSYTRILLAIDLWREGRGVKSEQEVIGMGWTVKNRADHPSWWGTTIIEVLTHKWQFSGMTAPKDPNLVLWPQTDDMDPDLDKDDPAWARCLRAADAVINGTEDPTNGAVFYYDPPITAPPHEWGSVAETVVIGATHFCIKVGA